MGGVKEGHRRKDTIVFSTVSTLLLYTTLLPLHTANCIFFSRTQASSAQCCRRRSRRPNKNYETDMIYMTGVFLNRGRKHRDIFIALRHFHVLLISAPVERASARANSPAL